MYAHLRTCTNTRTAHVRWVVIQLVEWSQGKYSKFFFSLSIGTNCDKKFFNMYIYASQSFFGWKDESNYTFRVFQYDTKYTDKPQHDHLEITFEFCLRHHDTIFHQHVLPRSVSVFCFHFPHLGNLFFGFLCQLHMAERAKYNTETFVVKRFWNHADKHFAEKWAVKLQTAHLF